MSLEAPGARFQLSQCTRRKDFYGLRSVSLQEYTASSPSMVRYGWMWYEMYTVSHVRRCRLVYLWRRNVRRNESETPGRFDGLGEIVLTRETCDRKRGKPNVWGQLHSGILPGPLVLCIRKISSSLIDSLFLLPPSSLLFTLEILTPWRAQTLTN